MQIPAPSALLTALRHAAPAGPEREISIDDAQHTGCVAYRDNFRFALSIGDWFTYTMHRFPYL
ncbi:hypothetical protein [Streptomyces cyaneofuscatus]|uniref:hypothetical protein n=1 Tax=Streptomyces cyaneofuscatus TaxID=66883 RepID=UPI0033A0FD58